jgi:hypothetical protein
VLIANPNLCIDRTQFVAELVPGAVMRALKVEVSAGGKGVNIARVVRAYGRRATLVGLVADNGGMDLRRLLAEEGADVVGVPVPGDVRMAVIMTEGPGERITVVNERAQCSRRETGTPTSRQFAARCPARGRWYVPAASRRVRPSRVQGNWSSSRTERASRHSSTRRRLLCGRA